jgi:hypothetical protein
MSASQAADSRAYDVAASNDFPTMIDPSRYGQRTNAFDATIAATHDHFWDPLDPAYIDYDAPFDMSKHTIMPLGRVLENSAVADRLSADQKIALQNDLTHWSLSNLLHGEQGALSLSAGLCDMFVDPGTQEYAANQAREEARHVCALSQYVLKRWGRPLPAGPVLARTLTDLVATREVYKKIIGMQIIVEGMALGAFATCNAKTHDPVLRRLSQLIMIDESYHHRFGKHWAHTTLPHLNEQERDDIEDWTVRLFATLHSDMANTEQKQAIFAKYGLDWQWARSAINEVLTDDVRRQVLRDPDNPFRVLTKTLLHSGIITNRTASLYATWFNLDELKNESHDVAAAAAETVTLLKDINQGRRRIGGK